MTNQVDVVPVPPADAGARVSTANDLPIPLLVDKAEACRLCGGISQRSVDRLVSCGRFPPPLKIGGRRLWDRQGLADWVRAGCPRLEVR